MIAKDQTQSPANRALSLTWLCHLVGDLHQLLHTTALFTNRRFRDGDRGGNAIQIVGQGSLRNLHALWDNVIGRSVSDRVQIRQAALIEKRFPISALVAPHSTDVAVWTRESVSLSETIAYGTSTHVSANDHESGKLAPIKISDDYRAVARKAAEERIALAGYRLAAMLANALTSDLDSQKRFQA